MNAALPVASVSRAEEYDLEFLRNQVRRCLRAKIPSQGSTLADRFAPRQKREGDVPLSKPRSMVTIEVIDEHGEAHDEDRVKPAHDQWATTTHATASIPAGFSREVVEECDFAKAKYVRAIAVLDPLHILSIRARYHPSKSVREESRNRLSATVATRYVDPMVRSRAKKISMLVLRDRANVPTLCALFGLDQRAGWRKSPHRKMLGDIKGRLGLIDAESLLAWDRECAGTNRS